MKKLLAIAGLIGIVGLAAAPAFADQADGKDTTTFDVKANVEASCKFTAASAIDFGNLNVYNFGTQEKTGSLTILCTAGPSYRVELDNGSNVDGSQRRMKKSGSANYLAYGLFSDAAHLVAWGAGATDDVDFTGDGDSKILTVYGQMDWSEALLPEAPTGSYLDTITATVLF